MIQSIYDLPERENITAITLLLCQIAKLLDKTIRAVPGCEESRVHEDPVHESAIHNMGFARRGLISNLHVSNTRPVARPMYNGQEHRFFRAQGPQYRASMPGLFLFV